MYTLILLWIYIYIYYRYILDISGLYSLIGNPPYFELKKTSKYYNLYRKWFDGRTNIYSLFILRSIEYLNKDGIIAFIIPPSWQSSKYFELLRNEIQRQGSIKLLHKLSNGKFMKTSQEAILFIFQKSCREKKYARVYPRVF